MVNNPPNVSIIIMNWNGWRDTIECLESLYLINYPNYDVILCDNFSTDNSVQKIKEYCEGKINIKSDFLKHDLKTKPIPLLEYKKEEIDKGIYPLKEAEFAKIKSNRKLRFILNDKDYKYAAGVNVPLRFAVKRMSPDYILLLNNDTAFEPDFLNELIEYCENNEDIGIVGPTIHSYHQPHLIADPHLKNVKKPVKMEWISGSICLLTIDLVKKIGFMDPRFIFFSEDKDYCYRAREAGFKVIYVPTKSKVYHKVGSVTSKVTGFRLYYKTRANLIFKRKHLSNSQFFLFISRYFLITIIMELKRNPKERKFFLKGVKDGLLTNLKHSRN